MVYVLEKIPRFAFIIANQRKSANPSRQPLFPVVLFFCGLIMVSGLRVASMLNGPSLMQSCSQKSAGAGIYPICFLYGLRSFHYSRFTILVIGINVTTV
jgi:hypothetical protein